MDKTAKIEWAVLALLSLIVIIAVIPSAIYARREVRDGIRRTETIQHKQELERIFNKNEAYPLNYQASPQQYVLVEEKNGQAIAWYIRAKLENRHEDKAAFDLEYNVYNRYLNKNGVTYFDICGGTSTCAISR